MVTELKKTLCALARDQRVEARGQGNPPPSGPTEAIEEGPEIIPETGPQLTKEARSPSDRQRMLKQLHSEVKRLAKMLPEHDTLGITEPERLRYLAALKRVTTFSAVQLQTLEATCERMVGHVLIDIRRAEANSLDS